MAAPGGDSREGVGTTRFNLPENRVLSTCQERRRGGALLNPDGTPNTPLVLRDGNHTAGASSQYLQATSMAAPHAAGGPA